MLKANYIWTWKRQYNISCYSGFFITNSRRRRSQIFLPFNLNERSFVTRFSVFFDDFGIFINLHLYAPYKEVLVNFTIYCNAVLKTMDMVKVIHQPIFNCSKSTIGTLKQEWKVYQTDTRTTPLTSGWCRYW